MDEDSLQQTDETYVFVKFLGEGSFGKVNLYRNTTDNSLIVWKEIALKKLEAKFRQEAFSEVEILSLLDHPNIITYYKHFIDDDILYIELEYAKGGTLANLIKQKKKASEYFEEETVIWYLFQLASGIEYIHELGIMHRDIKSLNIFFMQTGLLKIGDFGIAKILDPNNKFLQTLVGTPFYMSPEIVEGKKYSFKSDIWSFGCVAYEILTLSRVFDATNELKLALKISKCDITEINSEIYSNELKDLVKIILSKDPDLRPSAKEILQNKLFDENRNEFYSKIESLNLELKKITSNLTTPKSIISSKLSELYTWGGGIRFPKQIDIFRNENAPLKVSLGRSHYAVLTVEKELYTWTASQGGSNTNSYSKLGHGKNFGNTRIPKRVDTLAGLSIEKISCGEEITCCLTSQGQVYTWGSNLYGCLGLGLDYDQQIYDPTKIQFFEDNNLKVKSISCGDNHVIALTEDNRVFSWGCGEFGRLGHGDEDDRSEPTEIKFDFKYKFRNVFAGSDFSFILTKEGRTLGFGNNEFNKLCLNEYPIGLKNPSKNINIQDSSNLISQQLIPKLVRKLLSINVMKICPGHDHTAVIDVFGRLFTFGNNKWGQLGVGDAKFRASLNQVQGPLSGHCVTNAACGDTFTICSTSENHIFSWGNRKDGRLGLDHDFSSSNAVYQPKPIFGSLHLVSELCCKYWNSIIIAEKELESKPVRSVSYTDYLKEVKSDSVVADYNSTENLNEESTCEKRNFGFKLDETGDMPEWLKRDLEDADYIPIKALERSDKSKDESTSQENINQDSIKTLEEALRIIQNLKEENLELKQENSKLKEKLEIVYCDDKEKI